MRKVIVQFCDCFNGIRIAKYNDDGSVNSYVNVPSRFAPKDRDFMWIERRDSEGKRVRDKILPMIGISLTNVEYDNERKVSPHSRVGISKTAESAVSFGNPVPFSYTFDVKIAAEYMFDVCQILEQILPFYSPTSLISIDVPELGMSSSTATSESGTTTSNMKVSLTSSSQETVIDIPESDYRAIIWTLSFKVDGFLIKNTSTVKTIKKIDTKFYTTPGGWLHYADTTTESLSGIGHDSEEVLVISTSATKYDENGNINSKTLIFDKV